MKRLLFCLLLAAAPASATISISGQLKDGGGTVINGTTTNAYIRFYARGCRGNQPFVSGSALIVPNGGNTWFKDFTPDASGAISGTLYNTSEVNCGGSTSIIWYGMVVYINGIVGPESPVSAAGNININNPTILTSNPVNVAPTGDTTYLRLDGTNSPETGGVTFSGNNTFTGQNSLTAWNLSGVYIVDNVKYPCSATGINSAIADAIAAGGGTVDARGCISLSSYTAQISVGNTSSVPITLMLPPIGTWLCNITDGTSMCLKVFHQSTVIGTNSGFGSLQIRPASSSVNVVALVGNDTTVANAHIRVEGFEAVLYSGTMTAQAVAKFSGLGDGSYVDHMTFANLSSTNTPKVLWVNNSCCNTKIDVIAEAFGVSGVTPCYFGNGTTGPNLNINVRGACTHQGSGASALVDQQWNQFGNNYFNVYMENMTGADTTTAEVSIQAFGTPTAADTFINSTFGGDVAASTRYAYDIASGSQAIIIGGQQGGVSTNYINDHNANGGTFTAAVNTIPRPYFQLGTGAAGFLVSDTGTQTLTNKTLSSPVVNTPNLLFNATAPTFSSGFNAGSVQSNNGPASFVVAVGVGTAGSTGVITLPTANGGWTCFANNFTRADVIQQTGSSTTSATFTNFGTTFAATNWTNSDTILVSCHGR